MQVYAISVLPLFRLSLYALEEERKAVAAPRLRDMIDLATEENIKVIFYQEEIGEIAVRLTPLTANYTESLKSTVLQIPRIRYRAKVDSSPVAEIEGLDGQKSE